MSLAQINFRRITNVVLDLGGVLYAIDPGLTATALQGLAGPNARHLQHDDELFLALEMGLITPEEFRTKLRLAIHSTATDSEIDKAWNALLLGVIAGREEWIRRLNGQYRVILLSNTNVIHQQVWGPQCAGMFAMMEQAWFSFDLRLRKPNRSIYEHVLQAMGMQPADSLFLDDSPANIDGAKAAGMQAGWVDPQDDVNFERYCLELLNKT